MSKRTDLEQELETLPKGTIVRRNIRGTDRFYHQWRENGVTRNKYVSPGDLPALRAQLERRKHLEALRKAMNPPSGSAGTPRPTGSGRLGGTFRTDVVTGSFLAELAASVRALAPRDAYPSLQSRLGAQTPPTQTPKHPNTPTLPPTFLLGPRGVGKTTLLLHLFGGLSPTFQAKAAYIRLTGAESAADVTADLNTLRDLGFRYIFLDDADTLAALPGTGLTRILAGTRVPDALRGEVAVVDISFISYRERVRLTGETGSEALIEHGGILDQSGRGADPTTSHPVTHNPTTHNLLDRFVLDVLSLAVVRGKEAARAQGEAFLGTDLQKVRARFAELSGLSPEESTTDREALLDCPTAVRFDHARARIAELLDDPVLARLGAAERKMVRDLLIEEVRFRLLEDVLWNELRHAGGHRSTRVSPPTNSNTQTPKSSTRNPQPTTHNPQPITHNPIHRLPFAMGAYGFVVADEEELTCEIFIVTTDATRDPVHLRHLDDPMRLDAIEHRYGLITERTVLYNGRDARLSSGVSYRNLYKFLSR